MREVVLKDIKEDLNFLKNKIMRLEVVMNEIDFGLHKRFSPEYEKKLKRIQKQKGVRFKSVRELDKHLSM